jgi:hypothetical protein
MSKSCYGRWSVGQSVLVSSTHLGLKTRFLFLSDSCGFVNVGRPLWREDGSVFYNVKYVYILQVIIRIPGRTNLLLSLKRHRLHSKWCIQLVFYCCVYIPCRGNILPSRFIARIGGFLPSRCLATTGRQRRRHADWWEEFMKYASEMGSGAMIYEG